MTDLSPYLLPDGNVQIAFSGGRTSAYMLHQILEANGDLPERVKVVFANTGREMPETLDFVQEVSKRWSVPVTWVEYRLRWTGAPHAPKYKVFDSGAHSFEVVSHNSASRNGEPLIQMMEFFQTTPNREARFCSRRGKERTAGSFLRSLGWERWAVALGIRADEASRTIKGPTRDRFSVWYPLNDAGVGKRQVASFWERQPFDLRLPNVRGKTPLGNCDGCFLKSEANRAALVREYPDRAAWWAEQERRFGGTFVDKVSWRQQISFVERQGDWIFDTEGALCQADGGECTG